MSESDTSLPYNRLKFEINAPNIITKLIDITLGAHPQNVCVLTFSESPFERGVLIEMCPSLSQVRGLEVYSYVSKSICARPNVKNSTVL